MGAAAKRDADPRGLRTTEFHLSAASVLSLIGGVVEFGVNPDLAAGLIAAVASVYILARTWAKRP